MILPLRMLCMHHHEQVICVICGSGARLLQIIDRIRMMMHSDRSVLMAEGHASVYDRDVADTHG